MTSSNTDHHIQAHSGPKLFNCEICLKPFPTCGTMQRHMKFHFRSKKFKHLRIKVADTVTVTAAKVEVIEKENAKTSEVPISKDMYVTSPQKESDTTTYTSRKIKRKKSKCPNCSLHYMSLVKLREHIYKAHANEKISCTSCQKSFPNHILYVKHFCGKDAWKKELVTLLTFEETMASTRFSSPIFPLVMKNYCEKNRTHYHEDYYEYKCSKCNLVFPFENVLSLHNQSENDQTACTFCGQENIQATKKKIHQLSHIDSHLRKAEHDQEAFMSLFELAPKDLIISNQKIQKSQYIESVDAKPRFLDDTPEASFPSLLCEETHFHKDESQSISSTNSSQMYDTKEDDDNSLKFRPNNEDPVSSERRVESSSPLSSLDSDSPLLPSDSQVTSPEQPRLRPTITVSEESDRICPYCNTTFDSPRLLILHKRSRDGCLKKPYICSICKVGISSKPNFRRHMLKKHRDHLKDHSDLNSCLQFNLDNVSINKLDSLKDVKINNSRDPEKVIAQTIVERQIFPPPTLTLHDASQQYNKRKENNFLNQEYPRVKVKKELIDNKTISLCGPSYSNEKIENLQVDLVKDSEEINFQKSLGIPNKIKSPLYEQTEISEQQSLLKSQISPKELLEVPEIKSSSLKFRTSSNKSYFSKSSNIFENKFAPLKLPVSSQKTNHFPSIIDSHCKQMPSKPKLSPKGPLKLSRSLTPLPNGYAASMHKMSPNEPLDLSKIIDASKKWDTTVDAWTSTQSIPQSEQIMPLSLCKKAIPASHMYCTTLPLDLSSAKPAHSVICSRPTSVYAIYKSHKLSRLKKIRMTKNTSY